jgi:Protein of unknown function (DUF1579)
MRIRTKRLVATFAGLVVIGVLAHSAVSQDRKADSTPAGAGGQDAAAMAAMIKAGTPGKEHEALAKSAGTFDAEVITRMAPDGPEMKSKGKETSEMILGGRYLKSDFTGDMGGMTFAGTGLTAYDNVKKKWVSVWADSMSTGVLVSEGTGDAAGKTITFTGEYPDPVDGKSKKFRQVFKQIDDDHHEFEMHMPGPDGKEYRALQIKYTRAK